MPRKKHFMAGARTIIRVGFIPSAVAALEKAYVFREGEPRSAEASRAYGLRQRAKLVEYLTEEAAYAIEAWLRVQREAGTLPEGRQMFPIRFQYVPYRTRRGYYIEEARERAIEQFYGDDSGKPIPLDLETATFEAFSLAFSLLSEGQKKAFRFRWKEEFEMDPEGKREVAS